MKFLLPPYSKRHIIILGSITFFLAIGAMFTTKHLHNKANNSHDNQAIVTETSGEKLRQDNQQGVEQLNDDNDLGALLVNNLFVIDIRSADDFNKAHIAGANNIAVGDLASGTHDPKTTIVIYGHDKTELDKAADILGQKNIKSVQILSDDLETLEKQGYTIIR